MTDDHLLLHALADGELDAVASLRLAERLETESELAAEYARITAVKRAVAALPRPAVSDDFFSRMEALASPKVVPLPLRGTSPNPGFFGDWRATAASLVLTAVLASGGTYIITAQPRDLVMDEMIVGGHRRSLLAASPVDVASSDRHTVRPWFDTKLGVSPPTPDLTEAGFPLVGGRVDVIGGRAVPTLVYRHDKHVISVVAQPDAPGSSADRPLRTSTIGGYNVVRWDKGGFAYSAVSDVDAAELEKLAADLSSR